jgi:hypothetical protein
MALEGLGPAISLCLSIEAVGFGLGPGHDRGPDVGLKRQVDVDHAESVAMAAGTARGPLAASEVVVLLGLQLRL